MPDTLKLFSPAVSNWNLAHICTLLPEVSLPLCDALRLRPGHHDVCG